MKFKSDIEVQAGLKDSSGSNGTSGQVLSSSVSGVAWTNVNTTATDVQNLVKAGVAINKGQAVYVTSADGTNIIVGLASNTSEATSSKTLGLLDATVAINGMANVVQIGRLAGLNTIGAVAGDPVWLGANGNLIYGLANKPYAPLHLVFIGIVTRVNSNNGEIFINVQNGFELNEIHDVDLKTNIPINGEVLGFDGTLWVNKTIAGWLGYIPADDAAVVHLTGNEYIAGEKTFGNYIKAQDGIYLYKNSPSLAHISGYTTLSGAVNGYVVIVNSATTAEFNFAVGTNASYTYPVNSGTFALTSDLLSLVPYTGATSNVDLGSYSITADSFIKVGGTSDQYLKADGSVSTAMNSRIEANFIATSGQTTFITPYEVGQVDVYYNGSKLYPNEFTATNGTDIILATGATLNAQISIVKYVSSLSTTAIRNETTFTTTLGQTTFAVNYSPGQVDVFYNGSKLNISEFTATNGTSVVLGFACAAGESIVIDSYVNQISGASGTTDFVSKFTGAASLGDSQIFDNGVNLGINTITPEGKLTVKGTSAQPPVSGTTANSLLQLVGSLNNELNIGSNTVAGGYGSYIQASDNNLAASYQLNLQPNGGNVIIGGYTDNGNKLQVNGSSYFSGNVGIGTATVPAKLTVVGASTVIGQTNVSARFSDDAASTLLISHPAASDNTATITGNNQLAFATGTVGSIAERMRITSNGNVGIGTTSPNVSAQGSNVKVLTVQGLSGSYGGVEIGAVGNLSNTALQGYLGFTNPSVTGGLISYIGSTLAGTSGSANIGGDLTFNTKLDGGSLVEQMRIRTNGNINLNSTIYNNTAVATTRTLYIGSDYRIGGISSIRKSKKNIENISNVDWIYQLNPVTFNYRKKDEEGEYTEETYDELVYGLIAEDTEPIADFLINYNENDGEKEMIGIEYSRLITPMLKAIQELKAEIEILKNK